MRLVLDIVVHFYQSALKKNLKEWRVIFLCLLLSIVFWLINEFDKVYETTISLPINIKYDTANFVPLYELPTHVDVKVNGTGWDILRELYAGQAPVDYFIHHPPSAKALKQDILAQKAKKELKNINVIHVLSDSVKLAFNKIVTRNIRIYVNPAEVSVAKGYEIKGEPEINPIIIKVRGAESLVKAMAPSMPIVIEGSEWNKDIDADVVPAIKDFPYSIALRPEPALVHVKIKIRSELEEHLRIPIVVLNDDGRYLLKKKSAYVSFLVSKDMKYKVSADAFEVRADMSKVEGDTTVMLELVKYPDWVSDAKLEDKFVKVKPIK